MVDHRPLTFNANIPLALLAGSYVIGLIPPVFAQAPVNDVVSWPAGLLLLATVLYAALCTEPTTLWEVDPSIGFFMWSGLPLVALATMRHMNWPSNACHFVSGIRTSYGNLNAWVRAEEITASARADALGKAKALLRCVEHSPISATLDTTLWSVTEQGLLKSTQFSTSVSRPSVPPSPSARDFLLFAALAYHIFHDWDVHIKNNDKIVFALKGMQAGSVINVESVELALPIVAAQLVRRPHSQSILRSYARRQGDDEVGPFVLTLDHVARNKPVCAIDFHSYTRGACKVSASLEEFAGAYYRVVGYIKSSQRPQELSPGSLLTVNVGQSLRIALLGGATLNTGRLTIQNLPESTHPLYNLYKKEASADWQYVMRIEAILKVIEPEVRRSSFDDIAFSGGVERRPAIPFLLVGLFGQAIVCYFLSVGTSAGIWMSVALANSLFAGKLTDLHSMYYGKSQRAQEPGMKMRIPGTIDLLAVATFDRTAPRDGHLRPGLLLNASGLVGSILGSIYQSQTRGALGFGPFQPCQPWVVYTAAVMTVALSISIMVMVISQQSREKTWADDSELQTRWLIYSTLPLSALVAGLGAVLHVKNLSSYWPVLDALVWLSGLPLGGLDNGGFLFADENTLHLVLVTRWLMGTVASAVGSSEA